MRIHRSLERLAAAGRPLLAESDALVDAAEENRIRERIVSFDRSPADARRRPPRAALVLAAVTILAVGAAVAALKLDRGAAHVTGPPARHPHHMTLSGARIEMAGYHFRTPAGFIASKSSCDVSAPTSGPHGVSNSGPVTPITVVNGMKGAASADGGCVEVSFEIPGSPGAPAAIPSDAVAVDVGSYQGWYYDPGRNGTVLPPTETTELYVAFPQTDSQGSTIYLVLYALGLSEDQLIAVAQSGLPGSP